MILELSDEQSLQALRQGNLELIAIARDAAGIYPHGSRYEVGLSQKAYEGIAGSPAVQSTRFLLPTQPTVSTYPFDEIYIRPFLTIRRNDGLNPPFNLVVIKAVPGRLLEIRNNGGIPSMHLKRPIIQILLIVISSAAFILLALVVAIELFRINDGLSTIQEILAFAGYLLATAGFRDLLGFSKLSGTSFLEMAIVGVPIVVLSFVFAISVWRGWSRE